MCLPQLEIKQKIKQKFNSFFLLCLASLFFFLLSSAFKPTTLIKFISALSLFLFIVSASYSSIYFILLLKIKKAIKLLNNYNFDKAEKIFTSVYIFCKCDFIKKIFSYIDTQKKLIQPAYNQKNSYPKTDSFDNQNHSNELLEQKYAIQQRLKQLTDLKKQLENKISQLQNLENINENNNLKQQFSVLINSYNDMLNFTKKRIEFYKLLLLKLNQIENTNKLLEKLWQEKDELKKFQQQLLSEGFKLEQEDIDISNFVKREKIYLKYIQNFISDELQTTKIDEFNKLASDLDDKIKNLDLDTFNNKLNNFNSSNNSP